MLINLRNIKKTYSSQKNFWGKFQRVVCAVNNVNLEIKQGENMGLVGESGCGKTTLARILVKLISLDSGEILFKGEEITHLRNKDFRKYRKYIQMVFQDPYGSLDPRFTVRNIIAEALSLDKSNKDHFAVREKRIREALFSVNLKDEILDRYPHEFSGGERQRIAIARALVMNPQLLILDEAVSSLDVIIQSELLGLLLAIQKKFDLTYLFISHNLKVVQKICHKIAVMYKGKIVELAPKEKLFENPLHPYTKELLCAAMEYKSVKGKADICLAEDARLVEKEKDHFVLV